MRISVFIVVYFFLTISSVSGDICDINNDGKTGLEEAVYALQIVAGLEHPVNYRKEMADFVHNISQYARWKRCGFLVIPQNGEELLTENGDPSGQPRQEYIEAIDGIGREEVFYGYEGDDTPTPLTQKERMIQFMNIAENNGVEVMVTDYCSTRSFVDDSYAQSAARSYISFAADHRSLDNIPAYPVSPYNVNSLDIKTLSQAKNFLYLINPGSNYPAKADFINALADTDFDILLIDLFFHDGTLLTTADVAALKIKKNGGTRLVICYMSIGEAEDYRYYWKSEWETNPPPWLDKENPDWPGNYKVKYWYKDWQDIICGAGDSYLKKIIDAGFDGVYLDIIDAYEYFEGP